MPAFLRPEDFAFHASMLRDETRTVAFREAIEAVVEPGDVVCEIGAGTGILSLFARAAGARKVYAIELGPVADLARAIVRDNGAGDVIEVIHSASTDITLPERAGVLITETLWNLGVGEGILATVEDARRRLLEPDARMIPAAFEMLLAPVESPKTHSLIDLWSSDLFGFDFTAVREAAANRIFNPHLDAQDLLAPPQSIGTIDLAGDEEILRGRLTFAASRAGRLHGLGGFFRSDLAGGISISNVPPHAAVSWHHALLPFEQPIDLAAGSEVVMEVWIALRAEQWRWQVEAEGEVRRQSTLVDPVLSLEHLRKLAPDRAPEASARGRILAETLTALDGGRTVGQLTEHLATAHPDEFPGHASAHAFVQEILERWT